jgi:hypothetical protein
MDECRREPPIDELFREPAVRLLMERDGVDEATVRRLLADIGRQRRLEPALYSA